MCKKPDDEKSNVQINGETTKRIGGVTGNGFMPGQSGNPGGRPRRMPITQRYHELLETPLPEPLRGELEEEWHIQLPAGTTFADAMAVRAMLMALGRNIGAGRLDAAREVREAVEGRCGPRTLVIGPTGAPEDWEEQLKRPKNIRREVTLTVVRAPDTTRKRPNDRSETESCTKPGGRLIRDNSGLQSSENSWLPSDPDLRSGDGD